MKRAIDHLKSQKPVVGIMLRAVRPHSLLEMVDELGVDFVVIDAEHEAWNPEEIAIMVGQAERFETAIIVRVPDNAYALIARPLDDGADGVLIPRIGSAAEAVAAVRAARHPPHGERGVAPRRRLRVSKSGPSLRERVATLRENTLVLIQLETVSALQNIEEIVQTPGLSGVLIGPADLEWSLSAAGDERGLDAAITSILSVSSKRGLAAGISTKPDRCADWARHGASIFVIGSDWDAIVDGTRRSADTVRASLTAKS